MAFQARRPWVGNKPGDQGVLCYHACTSAPCPLVPGLMAAAAWHSPQVGHMDSTSVSGNLWCLHLHTLSLPLAAQASFSQSAPRTLSPSDTLEGQPGSRRWGCGTLSRQKYEQLSLQTSQSLDLWPGLGHPACHPLLNINPAPIAPPDAVERIGARALGSASLGYSWDCGTEPTGESRPVSPHELPRPRRSPSKTRVPRLQCSHLAEVHPWPLVAQEQHRVEASSHLSPLCSPTKDQTQQGHLERSAA